MCSLILCSEGKVPQGVHIDNIRITYNGIKWLWTVQI
jgi:hypothetical protein